MGPDLPSTPSSPEACLRRFQSGDDPSAFGDLFDATAPELFRVALAMLPDAATAEDVVQETYVGALGALERFESGRRVMPWLVGILQHKLQDARRSVRRHPTPVPLAFGAATRGGVAPAETAEEAAGVHRAMEVLPEPYRAVAILRWRYGLEPGEIAHVRNEPPGTTRSLLSRAIEKLRQSLKSAPAFLFGEPSPRGLAAVRTAVVRRAAGAAPISVALLVGGILMSKKIMLTAAALLGLAVGWVAWRAIVAPDVPTTIPAAKTPLIAPAPIPEPPVLAPAPLTVKPALATATASSPPKPPAEGAVVRNGNYTVEVDIRDVVGETPVPNLKVVGVWLESVVIMKGALPGSFRVVRHEVSALAGADGRAVLRAEGPAGPLERFEVGNDWHVVRWEREGDPKNPKIDSVDGSTTKIVMWVRRAFRLQGIVVGSDGQPIPGVDINFIVPTQIGADTMMGNQMSRGSHDGRFDLGLFAEDPGVGFPESLRKDLTQGSQITFKKDGYSVTTLDPRSVGRESRDRVTVTLAGGYSLAGVLVDGSGRALANATVAIEFGDEYDRRRGTRTDANGKWRIDRLGSGSAMLVARAFAADAKARRALTITADDLDVRIVAESIRFSHPPKSTKVMGLELAEVDDDLRSAYDVPEFVHVLILDPGPDADPLGIGRLEKGYGIMVVGEQTVHTLREVVEALLNQTKTPNDSLPGQKRIVYTFWDERSMGTNTQYVRMTEARVSSLKATLETLPK